METAYDQIVREDGTVEYPSDYDGTKGLKAGQATEMRSFFRVKPGHAEQVKEACRNNIPQRPTILEEVIAAGVHERTWTLFDNDTQLLFAVNYDTTWDQYALDALNIIGLDKYYDILKHCEGVPEGLEDDLPPFDFFKIWFEMARETAVANFRAYPDATAGQIVSALRLQEAFQQVLDHPDAAKALAHPALEPLLELAAD